MISKWLAGALMAACLLATPALTWATGSTAAVVSIAATVDGFAEWATPSPAIIASDWSGHITATNVAQTVTKPLVLYTNVSVTITPTGTTNAGILTSGSQTLITSYELTGAVDVPDGAFKLAGTSGGQFFDSANTYPLTFVSGTGAYTVNLVVKMISQLNTAPDAGAYTAGVTLTAAW